jgi:hypothetical protein
MTLAEYEILTGVTVPIANQTRVTAQIAKTQAILESLLGYSLDPSIASENQYDELGISPTECPCDTPTTLNPAEPVQFAYRLFPYNKKDSILSIDPAFSINQVKLVRNGITFKTIDDWHGILKNGLIKYLQQNLCWCSCCDLCEGVQLAVDAVWLGAEVDYNNVELPVDLQGVWAEMITYYSCPKTNIKSETLGSHSYTKFQDEKPEMISINQSIIKKYAGPNGLLARTITI